MVKYENGKIYSIRSYESDEVYIGSTVKTLSQRFSQHKKDYKKYLDNKYSYVTSFEIIKHPSAYIELVEEFSCNSKDQLNKREGEIIRATLNCVNQKIAGRTAKEYREDNKEAIKQYYKDNKEDISAQQKQYREANKEVIIERRKKKMALNSSTDGIQSDRNHSSTD